MGTYTCCALHFRIASGVDGMYSLVRTDEIVTSFGVSFITYNSLNLLKCVQEIPELSFLPIPTACYSCVRFICILNELFSFYLNIRN